MCSQKHLRDPVQSKTSTGSRKNYFGAKSGAGVAQTIIAAMPPHDTYIEPFAGSGVILKAKPPASRSYAIDRDKAALNKYFNGVDCETVHGCGIDFIQNFEFSSWGRVFIYCDPPYPLETRGKTRYKYEMEVADHKRLLRVLLLCPAKVMLSSYPNDLYDDILSEWRAIEFQTMTRGGVRTEKLYMNYDEGLPFYHTHAGKDRTDRQRIKRKAQRWQKKFEALPMSERQAILQGLMNCYRE